jgi:hypothetical protein
VGIGGIGISGGGGKGGANVWIELWAGVLWGGLCNSNEARAKFCYCNDGVVLL